jgi:hypothetical protein
MLSVLATRNDDLLTSPDGHRRQAKVLATIAGVGPDGQAGTSWERRSIGRVRTANATTTGPPSRSMHRDAAGEGALAAGAPPGPARRRQDGA